MLVSFQAPIAYLMVESCTLESLMAVQAILGGPWDSESRVLHITGVTPVSPFSGIIIKEESPIISSH